MLKANWLAFFVFVWVVLLFIGNTYEGYATDTDFSMGGYSSNITSKMNNLTDADKITDLNAKTGDFAIVSWSVNAFDTIYSIVTLKFTFFDNYPMLYNIFILPFAVLGIVSLVLLVYGIITGNLTWS